MPVKYITGRADCMLPEVLKCARRALESDTELIVVVPRQLTLETEIAMFDALGIEGSFRLQICSTAKLITRIFEAAGSPEDARIDDQGRAMALYRAAKKRSDDLVWYKDAHHRRGFAERALAQMQLFRQAGLDAEALSACAEDMPAGAARHKLRDLAVLAEEYEQIISGRYQDGEGELLEAISRIPSAAFLYGCSVCFYGFDMMPPLLHEMIAALAGVCCEVNVLLPVEMDASARDADVFLPMKKSLMRLDEKVKARGVPRQFCAVKSDLSRKQHPEIAHLARELFSRTPVEAKGNPKVVRLAVMRDPYEEAMLAASLCRELARTKGWRYREMLIVSPDVESRRIALERAFSLYGVPLYFADSRGANKHPLGRTLIGVMKMISGRYKVEDVTCLVRAGYMNISQDEADRFINYALANGLRGNKFKKEIPDETLETIRCAFFAPVEELEASLKKAKNLTGQLEAIFEFLCAIEAYEKCEQEQMRLIEAGDRTRAGESAQVWNRIVSALDQMHALMDEKKAPLKEIAELLEQSLSAVELKGLPQSADAVSVESLSRTYTTPVKALMMIGMSDGAGMASGGLFTDAEQSRICEKTQVWLGPDGVELARIARMYILSALSAATGAVYITYPMSGADDSALRPGLIIGALKRVFPDIPEIDTVPERMLSAAPDAAVYRMASGEGIEASAALNRVSDGQAAVDRFMKYLSWNAASDKLGEKLAEKIFGELKRVSASRLEQYAQCPFRHFVTYGLSPQIIEPYELKPVDEGGFFHEAVRAFLSAEKSGIQELPAEEASVRMEGIADRLLDGMMNGPLGDSAVSRAERRRLRDTACRAAWMMAEQLKGSSFTPVELEINFGDEEPCVRLHPKGGESTLAGRIDRIDEWPERGYLRVIDYKRGGRAMKLNEVYSGLQLQLIIYLAAAMKRRGGKCAGVYYFSVADPIFECESRELSAADDMRRDKLRLSGIFPNDPEILYAMSPEPERVMKVRMTKEGGFYKGTPVADAEEFDKLIQTTIGYCEKYVSEIREGNTEIAPVRQKNRSACDFCEYRAICATDGSKDRIFD